MHWNVLSNQVRPLVGVVVFVSTKLIAQQVELNNMAESLGGQILWKYDSGRCTHFIFQGRLNDVYKEFRAARNDKKTIVSPHWLSQVYVMFFSGITASCLNTRATGILYTCTCT